MTLRQTLRARRRDLTPDEQHLAAHALCDRLTQHFSTQALHHVAAYLPVDGEISLEPLMAQWSALGRQIYLPVVEPDLTVTFRPYTPGETEMAENQYQILEPVTDLIRPTHTLDLILLPLVGFDRNGNRMGMGKGYYDRTLSGLAQHDRQPLTVGVAHQCQETELVPAPWDIPVDAIATDQELIDTTCRVPGQPR